MSAKIFNITVRFYYPILNSLTVSMVILTEDIKDRLDAKGKAIDFLFCFRCCRFVHLEKYKMGDDVKCPDCHRDDNIKFQ